MPVNSVSSASVNSTKLDQELAKLLEASDCITGAIEKIKVQLLQLVIVLSYTLNFHRSIP